MQRITIPGTNLAPSAICYGTGSLGVGMDDAQVAALINTFRDAGGTFLDTAHVYAAWTPAGAGSSERAIGRYIAANGAGDLIVATKGGHPSMAGYRRVDRWLDPGRVHADIQDSLGRLGLEQIPLYYLHRDDTRFTVAEIIQMLNAEIASGTIAAIGASNWTHERLAEANAYAAEHGYQGFVASQNQWSLATKESPPPLPHGAQTRFVQPDDVAFHIASGLPLVAYTATAAGYFSVVPSAGAAASTGDRREEHPFDSPINRERARRVAELAASRGTTPTGIALAWLMHQRFPCIPITGTRDPDHLRENLGAATITLTGGEVEWLAA
mgnify:CR=1 FL=1